MAEQHRVSLGRGRADGGWVAFESGVPCRYPRSAASVLPVSPPARLPGLRVQDAAPPDTAWTPAGRRPRDARDGPGGGEPYSGERPVVRLVRAAKVRS